MLLQGTVIQRAEITQINDTECASLTLQQSELDAGIQALVQQRKDFESDVTAKRKALAAAKVKFKEVRAKKKKLETPLLSEIQNTLLEHNISAAAYHGGKLNGVDCHELIQLEKVLFRKIETGLLSSSNPDRCSNNTIEKTCSLYFDMCVTLDSLASKLQMWHGEPQEEDYKVAERASQN